jgi:murein DD-endopeptidase MepM/ murein hydrolase activator NlpD
VDPVRTQPLTRRELRERERAPVSQPMRKPNRSTFSKGFSVLAMTFAAAIAVATSIPAMALLTEDDVRAQAIQAQTSQIMQGEGQELVSDPGSTVAQITRDGTAVTSAEQVSALSHMRIADTFTNNPRGAIQWPFPVGVPISDFYGARAAPTEGASTNHLGVDFAPGMGVPIQIIADGIVREIVNTDNGGCGVNVTIDHLIEGALVSSKYCHMKSGSVRVSVGQQVKVTDIVGLVGNTGVSTGAHLHFEILLNGTEHTDPLAWLRANAS